ncbi:Aldo-keto reductase (Fragment) [Seminavis robusta]|uniref:Aldo-keto reductase n=1 Tax=Seminavis robusta TaxID=568900 RepID=A0A9N8HU44_9STRA
MKISTLCVASLSLVASSSAFSGSITKNVAVPGLQNGMDYCKLGTSDLEVSKVCMGTMTFGQQNTIEEGVEQLNLAFDNYGVNFIDTAELYPVPGKPETQGDTDRTVAAFMKNRKRDDVILATKVAGYSDRMTWMPRKEPDQPTCLSKEQILYSVDQSLKRLETDHIDLLQLHWPDRYTGGLFGQPDFTPTQLREDTVPFEETLEALQQVIDEGKVRYVGVSNETPFGVCSLVELAKNNPDKYPKIVSTQNSYSLVVRKDFEAGLAEACYHHQVGLLPYSPLAGGSLTGKYNDKDSLPETCRYKMFPGFMDRYYGSQNEAAVNAYGKIAKDKGMTPAQLALAWCFHREHVASTIIGATAIPQLKEDIEAYDIKLDEETLSEITKVYKQYTDPTKFA